MLRLAQRDYAGADAAADAAMKAAPEDVRALRAKARCLELAGKTLAASRLLDQALELRPTYGVLHLDKGALLLSTGKVKEAKKVLTEARKRDPDLLEVLLELGVVEEEEADWVAAERAYRAVLKEAPDHVEAHRMLSGVLFTLGKLGQADEEATWIKGRYPKDPQPWFTSGRVALKSEKFEDALASFSKACELEPAYALGHLGRGWVLEEQGKHEDAKKAYEAAVAADPKLPLPHRDLAELLDLMDEERRHITSAGTSSSGRSDEDVRRSGAAECRKPQK
jgi:Tfp pilus assembly protein PilF